MLESVGTVSRALPLPTEQLPDTFSVSATGREHGGSTIYIQFHLATRKSVVSPQNQHAWFGCVRLCSTSIDKFDSTKVYLGGLHTIGIPIYALHGGAIEQPFWKRSITEVHFSRHHLLFRWIGFDAFGICFSVPL